jgi:hypothetical protein
VHLVRETRSDITLSPPLVQVRADGELALAHLLRLGPGQGVLDTPQLRAGVALTVVFALAFAFALLGLDAVL